MINCIKENLYLVILWKIAVLNDCSLETKIQKRIKNTFDGSNRMWMIQILYFPMTSVYFREGNGTPFQYSCLKNPMDGGAWWAAVHGVAEGLTRLSDFTFTFHFHALEKEMQPTRVLVWRIPGTGEPGGLPSVGLHRVGHDWSDLAAAAATVILIWPREKEWIPTYLSKNKVQVTFFLGKGT